MYTPVLTRFDFEEDFTAKSGGWFVTANFPTVSSTCQDFSRVHVTLAVGVSVGRFVWMSDHCTSSLNHWRHVLIKAFLSSYASARDWTLGWACLHRFDYKRICLSWEIDRYDSLTFDPPIFQLACLPLIRHLTHYKFQFVKDICLCCKTSISWNHILVIDLYKDWL